MHNLDFKNTGIQVLVHPQYQDLVPKILEGLAPYDLKDHFVLLSSGTGGTLKGYALSKQALLANARATNEHFELTQNDVWGLSLPVYHVGGLSVLARAHLLKNKVVTVLKWNPEFWIKEISDVTITSIVPTQLYDLVRLNLKAPTNLRYLIVGGDFLSTKLKNKALEMGWPVIRTFGMSEVCSQLASAKTPESDDLSLFPIHSVKTNEDGQLFVKSESLFTLQFTLGSEMKVTLASELSIDGYYKTSDKVQLTDTTIKHLGRTGDEVKIAGHLVGLNNLRDTLEAYSLKNSLFGEIEFSIEGDERKGKKLVLQVLSQHSECHLEIAPLIHPVKIDEVRIVQTFNRTYLGKLKKSQS